jgi:transcriptional regulator with XRE-family HTH domain
MAEEDRHQGIGARIGMYRKLRGLTQRGLAMKANISYSTLTKVESGHSMAQPALVAAVARALSVDVTQLTGQPYMKELRQERLEQFVEGLRFALDTHDLLPTEAVEPRPTATIAADVAGRCRELRDGLFGQVAAVVPGLLEELRVVVAGHPGDLQGWAALFHGYDCVRYIASSWGFRDLAMLAIERMGDAANRSGDPLTEAVRSYQRSLELMRSGHYLQAEKLVTIALDAAGTARAGVQRTAVEGQTHLGGAIIAARAGNAEGSSGHLELAERAADDVGEVPNVYWLSFGPANVGVHQVASLIEMNRFDEATATASRLHIPADWHMTRVAHHHMDVARAHAWLDHHDAALRELHKARNLAPQRTRFHPVTRDTIEHLVETRRRIPENLARYARWVGI